MLIRRIKEPGNTRTLMFFGSKTELQINAVWNFLQETTVESITNVAASTVFISESITELHTKVCSLLLVTRFNTLHSTSRVTDPPWFRRKNRNQMWAYNCLSLSCNWLCHNLSTKLEVKHGAGYSENKMRKMWQKQ